MKSIGLIRVAVEAELLRLRALLKRQVRRGIYAVIAGIFALSVFVLSEILAWQALRCAFEPIVTTAVLLGGNVILMAIAALLAFRSAPSLTEREAVLVRNDALRGARSSLMITSALVAGRTYLDRRRRQRRAGRSV